MLRHSGSIIEHVTDGKHDDHGKHEPIDVVQLCFVYLHLYQDYRNLLMYEQVDERSHQLHGGPQERALVNSDAATTDPLADSWKALWQALQNGIKRYREKQVWMTPYSERGWYKVDLPAMTGEEILAADRDIAQKCLDLVSKLQSDADGESRTDVRFDSPGLVDALKQFVQLDAVVDSSASLSIPSQMT